MAPQINETDFLRYDTRLASRALAGRKPGTRGETRTTQYLVGKFKRMGLAPADHGAWLQPVPMISIQRLNLDAALHVTLPSGTLSLAEGRDVIAVTQRARPHVDIDHAPMVFLGYGIDAPALHWNDYQGLDVRGKIVIVLANVPGNADEQISRLSLAQTKFAQAARHGAAACFILYGTGASAHTWRALRNRYTSAVQTLPARIAHTPRLAVAGWLAQAAAERVFKSAGTNLDALSRAAAEPGFASVPLDARGSIRIDSSVRRGWSDNVVALIRGTTRPNEVLIYTAHWDALGTRAGRRPAWFPGAISNGSGLAALLEIAAAFAHGAHPPARSVLFLMPTLADPAQGGAHFYLTHPLFPLTRTVADIQIETWPVLGPAQDMTVFGTATSSLDGDLARVLAPQGRTLTHDLPPDIALFYLAGASGFARAGVPTLLAGPGVTLLIGGRVAGEARWAAFLKRRVDTPSDRVNPHWDLNGTLEDIQTLFLLGRTLANGTQWPRWAPGTPHHTPRAVPNAYAGGVL